MCLCVCMCMLVVHVCVHNNVHLFCRCDSDILFQDGEISDMSETVDRIVAASTQPLSIVIVGVGGANFTNMVSARTRHNIYLFFCTTTGYCAQHHVMNHNREFPVISYMYAFISNSGVTA